MQDASITAGRSILIPQQHTFLLIRIFIYKESFFCSSKEQDLSKKQLFFLALALLVGSFLGFLAGNLVATAHTSPLRAVSKTITITQFTCSSSSNNYDTDIGQFCPLDKVPLANQPTS